MQLQPPLLHGFAGYERIKGFFLIRKMIDPYSWSTWSIFMIHIWSIFIIHIHSLHPCLHLQFFSRFCRGNTIPDGTLRLCLHVTNIAVFVLGQTHLPCLIAIYILCIYIYVIYIYTCIDICIAIRLLIWRSSLKTNFCAFFAQKGGESLWPSQLLVLQNPMVDTRWEDGYHKKTSSNQSWSSKSGDVVDKCG